jgi:hypothetical protein
VALAQAISRRIARFKGVRLIMDGLPEAVQSFIKLVIEIVDPVC